MESLHKSIVQDFTYRFIVDDVSNGKREEFRCSIYDADNNLWLEGWGDTESKSIFEAMEGM
jgi:hypothetical protein